MARNRYGARLLALPAVLDLYRAWYTAVLVDGAQDFTPVPIAFPTCFRA
jgi:hypothetical protein